MSGEGGSGEKTEQPTPKKIRDSREKGQVAQSKELTSLASMIGVVLALCFSFRNMLQLFASNSMDIYHQILMDKLENQVLFKFFSNSSVIMFKVIIIPVVTAAVVSFVMNFVQINGLVLSKEFFKLDLNKLNPISNFKSIFSMKNLIKFIRQIIEITIMAVVSFYMFRASLQDFLILYYFTLANILAIVTLLFGKILAVLFLIHFAFGVFDLVMEKITLHKQLMMSLHEVKEENKNTEGNPEIKQKRRELQQELYDEDEFEAMLANAALILANPNHIAIAILYKPMVWQLPIILAKATDYKAQILFRVAKKLKIPVIRDKWLARQLYTIGELGKYVPLTLLKYVADVIGKNLHLMPKLAQEIASVYNQPKPEVLNPTNTGES